MSPQAVTTGVDEAVVKDFKDRQAALEGDLSTLKQNVQKYIDMYLLTWNDAPSGDGLVTTISPDPRNKILGAKRLLTTSVPRPSVVGYKIEKADAMERAATTILDVSSKAAGAPIGDTAVESALLTGEVHLCITSTKTLQAIATPNTKAMADYLAENTPYIINAWNPMEGYCEYGAYGLTGYLRKVKMTVSEIEGTYGTLAANFTAGKKRTDKFDINIFYDNVNWAVYVEDTAFVAGPHNLPSIPIITAIIDGSMLFSKPEERIQPFLYGYEKSGMWQRQNLALTVLYTNIFNLGVNPTFIHEAPPGSPDKTLEWDSSTPGKVLDLENGEKFYAMATKGVIDQSFTIGLDIANKSGEDSTIYQQALGSPPNVNSTFSSDSLMSQLGRLPLSTVQTRVGDTIGRALETALRWYSKGVSLKDWDIESKAIPTRFGIACKLDVDIQQDHVKMLNAAGVAIDKGIADREWVRRSVLNIESTAEMDENIAADRMFEAMVKAYIEARVPVMINQLIAKNPEAVANPDLKTPNGVSNGTNGQAAPAPGLGPDQVRAPDMNAPQAVPAGLVKGDMANTAAGGIPQVLAGNDLQDMPA